MAARHARTGHPTGDLPELSHRDPALDTAHLLALPADVGPDEVEVLAASRFGGTRWERHPDDAQDAGGRRPRGRAEPGPGLLRLSRFTTFTGPFVVSADVAARLGLPASGTQAYLVHAPRERGEPPWPGSADPDGLSRAFPDALPVREEARVLDLLVAAARRLHGALRIAGSGLVLRPDPGALVDLTVYSDIWLEPDAALAVVRSVLPAARLAIDPVEWTGPPSGTGVVVPPGAEPIDAGLRRQIHAAADLADMAALADPPPLDGYGVVVDLGPLGVVSLDVGWDTEVPLPLQGLSWTTDGVVVYQVRWTPIDDGALLLEHADPAHRELRSQVAPAVAAVAAVVHRAVGGEIGDAAGFLVHPQDLDG